MYNSHEIYEGCSGVNNKIIRRLIMSENTNLKRSLLTVARGLYVLTTCAVVLLALSFLNIGGH